MPTTTIDGHEIHVDDEGFMTDPDEWTEQLATSLAAQIGIDADRRALEGHPLPAHGLPRRRARPPRCAGSASWAASRPRRCSQLFPQKPAKKIAYVAGLPKPHGCV